MGSQVGKKIGSTGRGRGGGGDVKALGHGHIEGEALVRSAKEPHISGGLLLPPGSREPPHPLLTVSSIQPAFPKYPHVPCTVPGAKDMTKSTLSPRSPHPLLWCR